MSKYKEALNHIKMSELSYASDYYGDFGKSVHILEDLVYEKVEFESRKDNLIPYWKWECVVECYGQNMRFKKGNKVIVVSVDESDVRISYPTIYGWVEIYMPTEQFLYCFTPKEKGE